MVEAVFDRDVFGTLRQNVTADLPRCHLHRWDYACFNVLIINLLQAPLHAVDEDTCSIMREYEGER